MVLNRARAGFVLFITLSFLSVPTLSFAQTAASSTTDSAVATTTPATPPTVITDASDVEAAVRAYFADIPVMINIAKCESGYTQFNSLGHALNGGSGGMMGVYQVNKSVHAKFALTLGDDITTLAGNLAYARYLYNNEGTGPWVSSEWCWGTLPTAAAKVSSAVVDTANSALSAVAQVVTPTTVEASTGQTQEVKTIAVTGNLKLGTVSPQVALLQQNLNAAGYKIAASGTGSPGHEGTKFGALTKAAVQRFQCTHNIACSGTESTTGYGLVGAKTRLALSRAVASVAKA